MELRQLRYFVGISQAGSLLKASTRLHVAQPALSLQMAALESDLGARLFDRSSRGVALTDAGRVFLEHAKVVLADLDRAGNAVREVGSVAQGEVAIGLPTTVGLTATLGIVQAARAELPQVRLKVVEAYSGFLREWLLSGRIDLAVLAGDGAEAGLTKHAMLDEALVYVTHTRAGKPRRALSLQALAERPLVLPGKEHGLRRTIDAACEAHQIKLEVVAEIDSLRSVKLAAIAGIGDTILTRSAIAEEEADGRLYSAALHSDAMKRRLVIASSASRPGTLARSAVQALVCRVIHGMVRSGAWPARWVGRATVGRAAS